MDPRSRIKQAFAYKATDRIPRYEIFLDGYQQSFRQYYDFPEDYDLYDWYDRIDIGTVLADQRGPFYAREKLLSDDGDATVIFDSWGRKLYQRRSAYFERVLDVAIKDKNNLDKIVFDDPGLPDKYESFIKAREQVSQRFAAVSGVLGLFMGSYRMRGEIDYLLDLAIDPGFCLELCERLCDFLTISGLKIAQATKTYDTAIWVYDELCSNQGPLFSPETFYKIFYPSYKKMIKTWRDAGITNVILHCDGNSLVLLDMLIDAGFTGIQGVAPSAGMWLPDIKKQYGNRLILIGGMDNIHTLAKASISDIERQTDAMIEAACEGGVVLGTHSIDGDIPVEKYNAYSQYLDEHGTLCTEKTH